MYLNESGGELVVDLTCIMSKDMIGFIDGLEVVYERMRVDNDMSLFLS